VARSPHVRFDKPATLVYNRSGDTEMTKLRKLTVMLDPDLHRHVKAQSALQDKTVSDVVRELLRKWLEEQKKQPHEY
jgi:hypothetical protein